MRVAHVVEGFDGGIATYMRCVLPALSRAGVEVTLICSTRRRCANWREIFAELEKANVRIITVPMCREIRVLRDMVSLSRITRILIDGKFDAVHTHCSKAGVLGRVAGFLACVPCRVHTPHCFAFTRYKKRFAKQLYVLIEKWMMLFTHRVAAVSESEIMEAAKVKIGGQDKFVLIRNGVSSNNASSDIDKGMEMRKRLEVTDEERVVLSACRFTGYKCVGLFVEAAKHSKAESTVFVAAGDGEMFEEVKGLIEREGLAGKVRLAGYVTEMVELYGIADVFVLCSEAEAQPYAILEAMANGCAVAVSDAAGNRELVGEGRGVVFERKAEAIAEAVDQLLGDEVLMRFYRENAEEYVRKNHQLQQQTDDLLRLYREGEKL